MYYPSVDVSDFDMLDAIQFRYVQLQTGQWIHDLISKGRIVNSYDGTAIIVWFSPKETLQKYNERFCRIVAAYKELPQVDTQLPLFGDLSGKTSPYLPSNWKRSPLLKKNSRSSVNHCLLLPATSFS